MVHVWRQDGVAAQDSAAAPAAAGEGEEEEGVAMEVIVGGTMVDETAAGATLQDASMSK